MNEKLIAALKKLVEAVEPLTSESPPRQWREVTVALNDARKALAEVTL